MTWNPAHPPRQDGRTFVVTGGNSGLGYFTVEQLAGTGAHVVIASRNQQRMDAAAESVRGRVPGASIDTLVVDTSSLESVRTAGAKLAEFERLDGLIFNAGLLPGPVDRTLSTDGFELIMATNFIGHFALTAYAWPALLRTPGSRVVGLGSLATVLMSPDPGDMLSQRRYSRALAYGYSKHAIHGFILELDRRLRGSEVNVSAMLAHPGFAIDSLTPVRPGIAERSERLHVAAALLGRGFQGKNRGAAPTVQAALDTELISGDFVGPQYLTRGKPRLAHPVGTSASREFGEHIWALGQEWTGLEFEV